MWSDIIEVWETNRQVFTHAPFHWKIVLLACIIALCGAALFLWDAVVHPLITGCVGRLVGVPRALRTITPQKLQAVLREQYRSIYRWCTLRAKYYSREFVIFINGDTRSPFERLVARCQALEINRDIETYGDAIE
ncbi:MAG: hypothetical protein HGA67_03680 [Candidatus Yonathbacteria bacterium]|nr:hypothetical protein [Candidatus Yonathbacteria bacterium]